MPWCVPGVLEATLRLASEIASEGHEGDRTGALFTLGHERAVLSCSRPLILDPLLGHVPESTHISDARLRGTIKQLARLDGAFVITADGTVVSACRYLDAPSLGVDVPLGLGSRHVAAVSISKQLNVLSIAVSETGIVRVFYGGELLEEIRDVFFG